MATGIVSVGLHLVDLEWVSWLPLALAAAVWVVLAVDFAARLVWDRGRWIAEADTPPALTGVAATTVLGTRLALLGWDAVAALLLIVAAAVWPLLLYEVIGHWQRRMPGAAFLVCVSTQGLAVLSATLGPTLELSWLTAAGLVAFVVGLVLYVLAFAHFDLPQIWTGAGDQWVATGALAISALAGAKLVLADQWTGAPQTVLRVATVVVLTLTLLGYLILMVAEAARPRSRYDIRRWATVFPLGMTAVATWFTGSAVEVAALHTVGALLLAVAVGAWLLTFVALLGDRATFHPDRSR